MRIEDLDEFQGLTWHSASEWLREQGFDIRLGGLLHAGRYLVEWEPIESAIRSTEASLYAVAQYRNQSVQSLLREINPRMRKGMPSEAAREAHGFKGGMWVGSRGEAGSGGTLVFVSFDDSSSGLPLTVWDFSEFDTWEVGQSEIDDEWLFWPADESGNKTRWPVDAEGKML